MCTISTHGEALPGSIPERDEEISPVGFLGDMTGDSNGGDCKLPVYDTEGARLSVPTTGLCAGRPAAAP